MEAIVKQLVLAKLGDARELLHSQLEVSANADVQEQVFQLMKAISEMQATVRQIEVVE